MASKQEIEIVISPDGEVKLEVRGIKGPACAPVVKKLADAVGELKSQNFTSEYYEKVQKQTQSKQGS